MLVFDPPVYVAVIIYDKRATEWGDTPDIVRAEFRTEKAALAAAKRFNASTRKMGEAYGNRMRVAEAIQLDIKGELTAEQVRSLAKPGEQIVEWPLRGRIPACAIVRYLPYTPRS